MNSGSDWATDTFISLRPLLFTIAYEIIGTAADAEDVVSDSYLRWRAIDPATVDNARAYLTTTVTRQALNALRSAQRRREDYIGPWLPEPIATTPDVADNAILAESVSMAMLVLLESLTPDERVVLVMHDVFDFSYTQIADVLDKTPASIRQIAHRARGHVQARRPRYPADAHTSQRVSEAFMSAVTSGDMDELLRILTPDVTLHSDGGGVISTARKPVVSADRVARFMLGLARKGLSDIHIEPRNLNGASAWAVSSHGVLDTVFILQIADEHVSAIYAIRNPAKLSNAVTIVPVTR